jgi:hypothetical protein
VLHSYKIRLERLLMNICYCLFDLAICDEEKSFVTWTIRHYNYTHVVFLAFTPFTQKNKWSLIEKNDFLKRGGG